MSCISSSFFKKIATVAIIATVFCFNSFSQSESEEEYSDLEELFSDASDAEEGIVSEVETDNNLLSFLTLPLKMSGELGAEVGVASRVSDDDVEFSAYFDLENYLYFTTRPDKYMAVKGSLKTSMPDASEADDDGHQNHYFYLYELYFDYILGGKVYLTAGKKKTTWGNVRLFSNSDEYYGSDSDAQSTNALYDSRYNISGIIKVPFGPASFTVLTMYDGDGTGATHRHLSFAASLEAVLFNTSINLYGRTFPSDESKKDKYCKPIVGLEVKKTLFGVDFYMQSVARPINNQVLKEFWRKELYCRSAFDRVVFTGGCYKLWTNSFPYIGVNAEYQGVYYPNKYEIEYDESDRVFMATDILKNNGDRFVHKLAIDFGMAKLGKNRNLKVGIQMCHDITNRRGQIKPGIIISRIIPHCDWRSGFEYEYDRKSDDSFGKLTFGTYLRFALDY